MREIFRNTVVITTVSTKKGFAFGATLEKKPRAIFFPHWIVDAFKLTKEDMGAEFDCLFVDQEEDRNPLVIAIIDEEMLDDSKVVGEYTSRPGQSDFSAKVENALEALNKG